MPTIENLLSAINKARMVSELLGAEGKWIEEFQKRSREIGDAIQKDFEISKAEARKLPPSTKLGPRATHLFEHFQEWLNASV